MFLPKTKIVSTCFGRF